MKIAIALLGILLMANNLAADPMQGWEYQYQDYGTGTKSESICGKLLFQGHEIPKEFEHVITPIGEFAFGFPMGWSGVQVRWAPYCGGIAITAKDVKSLLSGANPAFRKYTEGSQTGEPIGGAGP